MISVIATVGVYVIICWIRYIVFLSKLEEISNEIYAYNRIHASWKEPGSYKPLPDYNKTFLKFNVFKIWDWKFNKHIVY